VTAALESVVEPLSLDEPVYTDGGDAMYVIDQVRDPDRLIALVVDGQAGGVRTAFLFSSIRMPSLK
jgi:hypothetical protein